MAIKDNDLAKLGHNSRQVKKRAVVPMFRAVLPDGEKAVTATQYRIGRLPPHSLLTNITVVVDEAFDGTAYAIDLGIKSDTDAFKDNLDVSAETVNKNTVDKYYDTYTDIFLTPTITGTPTKGSLRVVIEYIELNTTDGAFAV